MQCLQRIHALRDALHSHRRAGQRIGLVPTMGNLHDGHLALVAAARQHADIVVASIFVNPTQFGPGEDLEAYPRTLEADCARLREAGCDLVFVPDERTLYPRGGQRQTRVSVPEVSQGLCGGSRPGHFDGVATIVTMLFNLVQPDLACFGEKDYQQLAVIRRLVEDLHLPIEIIGVPIVRDADGLAMSSRNGYLTTDQRRTAPHLQQTLRELGDALEAGAEVSATLQEGRQRLCEAGFEPDYLELRAADLSESNASAGDAVLLAAAWLGSTRLIDNLTLRLPAATSPP
ncbi:pantoate--beta-alanine ligase [Halomonas sp. 18H]|uniref:pantoate--beta-alanine ligase n=1 Tax=Halomonas almeriensis TaxID=308163 RepID=UPI00222E07E1|nr:MULTISPECIES: pantoate--beta-alanine ligase [Halomonas]MCW4153595.1 pantoate--beta-alanine ligase [Halomonas sp. 18H]MDN3552348.1 pantoate--beta-alanine ligase [Halomonas almeriensis]